MISKNSFSKQKVLYLHDRPSGGAGESLFQIINKNSLWATVCVIFKSDGYLKWKFSKLEDFMLIIYIKSASWLASIKGRKWLFWPSKLYYFKSSLSFYKHIAKIVKEKEVNIIHSNTINIIEGGIFAKKKGITHFIQIRELIDLDYYKYPISKRKLVRILNRYSNCLIANSKRTKKGLIELGTPENKIRVIYNAVTPANRNLDIREYLNLPQTSRIVAIVGWITPIKNINTYLKIAETFQESLDIKFLVIGKYGFDKPYNEKIKDKIETLANTSHIELIPNITEYMASFNLLISLGLESFGRTVAEALIMGTPAIGIKGSAVEELIIHNKSGFILDGNDIDLFIEKTKLLLDDESLNERMGEFGKIDAEKRFGLEVVRKEYLRLYEEFIK